MNNIGILLRYFFRKNSSNLIRLTINKSHHKWDADNWCLQCRSYNISKLFLTVFPCRSRITFCNYSIIRERSKPCLEPRYLITFGPACIIMFWFDVCWEIGQLRQLFQKWRRGRGVEKINIHYLSTCCSYITKVTNAFICVWIICISFDLFYSHLDHNRKLGYFFVSISYI